MNAAVRNSRHVHIGGHNISVDLLVEGGRMNMEVEEVLIKGIDILLDNLRLSKARAYLKESYDDD